MIAIVTRCARIQWAHTIVSVGQASLAMERRAVFVKASNHTYAHVTCNCYIMSDDGSRVAV